MAVTSALGQSERKHYWSGVDRTFATTEFGNVAAIAAHNCYSHDLSKPHDNLAKTLRNVHTAQRDGADLIELDIKYQHGEIYVDHEDDKGINGAKLSDVFADKALLAGDQILFIEIKEENPTETFVQKLLQQIENTQIAREGRPVVFRAFEERSRNLTLIQEALKSPKHQELKKHFRLHVFIRRNAERSTKQFHSKIRQAKESGFDGVEFRYDATNLHSGIGYAKSLGLGVGVFTIPKEFGEVFIAGLREDVDSMVVDYSIKKSRQVVKDQNGLVYFNSATFSPMISQAKYFGPEDGAAIHLVGDRCPLLTSFGHSRPMFGTVMEFGRPRCAKLYDADNAPNQGYLVSTVVTIPNHVVDGQTEAIISKADNGGFALEIHNPSGLRPPVLRFGVRVKDDYVYAETPTAKLKGLQSHFIVGAYDGKGGVRMWIDGKDAGVTSKNADGGVVQNNSPITVGADPQGAKNQRYHFNGAIQQIQVQDWGSH